MGIQIKVCGMKDPENIRDVISLHPDYMGFIFYSKSQRFVGELDPEILKQIPENICKVGVFVDENALNIFRIVQTYGLNAVQLHGKENPATCRILRRKRLKVIKALSVSKADDLLVTSDYQTCCDYLLFDTKTPLHGGSGQQFDWNILNSYTGRVPFFLSGGIGPDDAERITALSHPQLKAIDINSRFEIEPGRKDTKTLAAFLNKIRKEQQDTDY